VFNKLLIKTAFLIFLICMGGMASRVVYAQISYQLPSGEILHDPTKPGDWGRSKSATPGKVLRNFTLNYIVQSSTQKRAMINGKKVEEGDKISGAIVTRIQQNAVTLMVDGETRILRLNKTKSIRKN